MGCYQTNEIGINKMNLCTVEETQKLHLKWDRYIYPLIMQLWGTWDALICSHKWINHVLIHKTLHTDIWNDLKHKKIAHFKCEIKTTSRWQQVTVNKWVTAVEPNHLKVDSFRNETPSCCSEMQNSAVAVFGITSVGEIKQKQELWCLKRKSLNVGVNPISLSYPFPFVLPLALVLRNQVVSARGENIPLWNEMPLGYCYVIIHHR